MQRKLEPRDIGGWLWWGFIALTAWLHMSR